MLRRALICFFSGASNPLSSPAIVEINGSIVPNIGNAALESATQSLVVYAHDHLVPPQTIFYSYHSLRIQKAMK